MWCNGVVRDVVRPRCYRARRHKVSHGPRTPPGGGLGSITWDSYDTLCHVVSNKVCHVYISLQTTHLHRKYDVPPLTMMCHYMLATRRSPDYAV